MLELEAIKSIKSWRKNAAELSDIPIHVLCITNNTPSKWCVDQLERFNVQYTHNYMPESDSFNNGWWNKPLACSWFENNCPYEYIIHIDLDMYLVNRLSVDYKTNSCLVYDDRDAQSERILLPGQTQKPFNTCFITGKRKDAIFTRWYETLKDIDGVVSMYYKDITKDKYEEAAMDIFNINNKLITDVEHIMFGETYTKIDEMLCTDKICFQHYHIYKSPCLKTYNYSADLKRYKSLQLANNNIACI